MSPNGTDISPRNAVQLLSPIILEILSEIRGDETGVQD